MKMKPEAHRESKIIGATLIEWYQKNKRDLPWRINQDPYRVWISEVMLQQTTVQAVIPFYEKFIDKFPNAQALAQAKLEEVYDLWTGLGYYSRARNLHLAAQEFARTGFPKTYLRLLEYPGLGPYTARAVSSLAFQEPVGVLDGNVIRVLSRFYNLATQWWKPEGRHQLQELADQLAQHGDSSSLNQGLMELGATVCTTHNPTCLLCPWSQKCQALIKSTVMRRPLKKPRKKSEVWIWKPEIFVQKNQVAVIKNNYAPFLKGQLIFPGQAMLSKAKPTKYVSKHTITHHQIFIQPTVASSERTKFFFLKNKMKKDINWVSLKNLHHANPSVLLKKALSK